MLFRSTSFAALLLGDVVIFAFGLTWLHTSLDMSWSATIKAGFTPFIFGEALKIAITATSLDASAGLVTAATLRGQNITVYNVTDAQGPLWARTEAIIGTRNVVTNSAEVNIRQGNVDISGIVTSTSGFVGNINSSGVSTVTNLRSTNINATGVVTSTNGFISVANTTPIQISLVGNRLTFTAVGIGSTTLTLF